LIRNIEMNVEYKVVETKVEGDWGHQLIEMPYEVFQLILKEFEEDSDHAVGNTVVCNPEMPYGFAWETFDFVDPSNPDGNLIDIQDVPEVDVVTMVLTINNEMGEEYYHMTQAMGRNEPKDVMKQLTLNYLRSLYPSDKHAEIEGVFSH
jgi:hypothetical protein